MPFQPRILEMVVTDNGSNFVSDELENFLKENGNCCIRTTPYHHSSKRACKKCSPNLQGGNEEIEEWKFENQSITFLKPMYRIIPQTTTGVLPAELLLGRKPKSRLDLIYPEIGRKVRGSRCHRSRSTIFTLIFNLI